MSATEMPVVLAGGTKIEWAHFTFNPVWGCCRVSPACRLCYAEALAKRYGHDVWGATAGRRTFGDAHWREPLKWNRKAGRDGVRRRVFCASMADVFEDHPAWPEQRARLWGLIGDTAHLDWLLLTKRPQNIPAMVPAAWMAGEWPAHVWAGATVEDQQCAELRIPQLQVVPAPVRFLSCEPLLGAFPRLDLTGIGWVIVGGETGPDSRRREMDLDALAAVADACDRAVVPLFVKQDSGRHPGRQGRIPDSLWARKDVPHPERPVDISEAATWPPALCERPIKAMCPLRVCTVCGEPSRRLTTTEQVPTRATNGHKHMSAGTMTENLDRRTEARVETVGWTDCGHGGAWRAGRVLDPFAGSGTTGWWRPATAATSSESIWTLETSTWPASESGCSCSR